MRSSCFVPCHRPRSSLTIEKIDAMSLIYSRRFVSINIKSFLFSIRRRFIVFFLYLINIFERSILSMLKCWKRKLLKQITFTRYEKSKQFRTKSDFFLFKYKNSSNEIRLCVLTSRKSRLHRIDILKINVI